MKKVLKKMKLVPLVIIEIVFTVFLGYPFVYLLSTALKSQTHFFKDPVGLFTSFTLENFDKTFDMGFMLYFLNSAIVVIVSVLLLVILATMSSYALVRIDFKINRLLSILLVSGMMLPMHASLIPIFSLENKIGIYDSLLGLILPQLAFAIPISVFITMQFMEGISSSILEAAKIDGAGHVQIFRKIAFPLLHPAIVTIVIYNGVRIWNNFSFALVFTQSKRNYTIPLGLQDFYGEFAVNVPGILSAITLATLPVLILYFCMQETVVRGLTGGAVKE